MSEFLAEAAVLIRPDTTKFRATLLAELEAQTKGIIIPVAVVASSAGLAGARQAQTATASLTATKQKQAAVDAVATRQAVNLAEAQRLETVATERLAAVEQAGSLATTELAAAKAKLRAAEAALVAARQASVASLAQENVELRANVAATLQSAEAEAVSARAAAAEAAAHSKASGAVAAHAAAEAHLARGAAATSLSLFGLRGATLAASAPFLLGAAAVTALAKSVHEFTTEQEAAARAEKIFGAGAKNLEQDARGLAAGFGLSAAEALKFEGAIGNILKISGFVGPELANTSEELTKLAADLATFANVPLDQTLRAIQLGLAGNSRGLRQFGIDLTATTVKEEALRESGKKHAADLTRLELTQARVNLLFKQTADAQGAAAARSGNLSQKTRILRADLGNLGSDIGRVAIPAVSGLVHVVDLAVRGFEIWGHAAVNLGHFLDGLSGFTKFDIIQEQIDSVNLHFEAMRKFEEKVGQEAQRTSAFIQAMLEGISRIPLISARVDFKQANNQLATLQENLVGVKIAGGDATQELANLAKQEIKARQALAAAEKEASILPGSPAAQTRRRQAKDTLLGIIEQERTIKADQAQKAKQIADDIAKSLQDAADFVKQKLQEATQALLDSFTLEQAGSDLQQTRAQATKSLVDDLAELENRRAILQREITVARRAGLDAQEILNLEIQLAQTNNQIRSVRAQRAQNRTDRRRAAFERAASSVDLDISLAQTNKDIRGEIAARQRRITLDQERMKSVRGDTIATKQLRNDIAEQRAAIKALRGDLDKRRKDLLALEFEFLQTQTGFVGNLLSNLLPTGAVAGTVGAGAIGTPTGSPRTPAPGGGRRPAGVRGDLSTEAASSSGPRSATSGQMSTLITINRQMLSVLIRLVGQRTHPEATNQRIHEAADMDIF